MGLLSYQNEGGPEWLIGVPCAGVCVCVAGRGGPPGGRMDGRGLSSSLLSAGLVPFFEVRFRGWGIQGCVLLTENYKMSHRT